MMIGVEEEFIIVNTSNFFYTPASAKVLINMLLKNRKCFYKSSLETPLGRNRFPRNMKDLYNGFSIFEMKTSPHKSIDSLKEEILFNRSNLIDILHDDNLAALPIGIHPLFSPEICGIENCAALHIHIDGAKKNHYLNILQYVPQIIALTANSPFINGKFVAMCSRALYSPSIGIPINFYNRTSDLIFNKFLNTTELRACDAQIIPDDIIGLVATIECITSLEKFTRISRGTYSANRMNSVLYGKNGVDLNALLKDIGKISEELSLADIVHPFFKRRTGTEWQIECQNQHGFSTLLKSIWASMKNGKYTIEKSNQENINSIIADKQNLIYSFLYSPLLLHNILKKIRQDDAIHTTNFFGKLDVEKSDIFI
jgi:hypothetical protein